MSLARTWDTPLIRPMGQCPKAMWENLFFIAVLFLACWAALLRFWGQWLGPDVPSTGLWSMLAAVVTWAVLFMKSADGARIAPARYVLACATLLFLYALSYPAMPRLVSSTLAVLAVSTGLLAALPPARRRCSTGLALWMIASLPLGVAVNIYFGYPLRLLVGWLASCALGGSIDALGAGLTDGNNTVFIDAPCSGITMLRVTVLLVGVVAVLCQLRIGATILLALLGMVLAIAGNVARVSTLFVLYGMGEVAPWLHEWTGLLAFVECAALVVVAALYLRRWEQRRADKVQAPIVSLTSIPSKLRIAVWSALGLSAMGAAMVPFTTNPPIHQATGIVTWPTLIEGEQWDVVAPDKEMLKFQETYIGDWVRGELRDSGRNILLRQCDAPTLTLHPTDECYRAYGFNCSTLDAWVDSQGHLWSKFLAVHPDGRVFTVRQCFFSIDPDVTTTAESLSEWTDGAKSWPDMASWYWAAARPGSGVKRTFAVAIAEAQDGEQGGEGIDD